MKTIILPEQTFVCRVRTSYPKFTLGWVTGKATPSKLTFTGLHRCYSNLVYNNKDTENNNHNNNTYNNVTTRQQRPQPSSVKCKPI